MPRSYKQRLKTKRYSYIESIEEIVRKLSREKSTWETRRFLFCACVTWYECLR